MGTELFSHLFLSRNYDLINVAETANSVPGGKDIYEVNAEEYFNRTTREGFEQLSIDTIFGEYQKLT